ncbi:MAG: hypothetical protein ACRDYE_14985 [Acidimicrobiales bacterium]
MGIPLMWAGWGLAVPLWMAAAATGSAAIACFALARRGSRRRAPGRRAGR